MEAGAIVGYICSKKDLIETYSRWRFIRFFNFNVPAGWGEKGFRRIEFEKGVRMLVRFYTT